MAEFRIYYSDGSTHDGDPESAAGEHVQCIALDDPSRGAENIGRIVLRDWDIFIYSEGIGWHGTNKYADLRHHLAMTPCKVRKVVFGEWICREDFKELLRRAETDPPFREKSANDLILEDGTE